MDWSFANIDWPATVALNWSLGVIGIVAGLAVLVDSPSGKEDWERAGARLILASLAAGLVGVVLCAVVKLWPIAFPGGLPRAVAREKKP